MWTERGWCRRHWKQPTAGFAHAPCRKRCSDVFWHQAGKAEVAALDPLLQCLAGCAVERHGQPSPR